MAELNLPLNRSAGRRFGGAAISAPRIVMSWEDWLTFLAALITFLSVAISIQQAHWVNDMPPLVPTALGGLLIGLFAARTRVPAAFVHPVALALGAAIVVLMVQSYADGTVLQDRLADTRFRMVEWYRVVREGDISNDDLPFIMVVHAITFLSAYVASWSIYRWHNAWLAAVPGGVVMLANIGFQRGQPSGAFVVFLFGTALLVGRVYLQKSQLRWRRDQVDYPDFVSLNALQFSALAAIVLIIGAWLAPLGAQQGAVDRVLSTVSGPLNNRSSDFVRLFHNIKSTRGGSLHSFGPTLPVNGNVKLGTAVLFEIGSTSGSLVRATSYDEYTGTGWKVSSRLTGRVGGLGDLPDVPPEAVYKMRTVTLLHVTLQTDQSTILTAGTPIGSNVDTFVETPKSTQGDIERLRSQRDLERGDTYNAIGSESSASAADLRLAGVDFPSWVRDRYLQLPNDLPARVGDEARRVAAAQATPYDKAAAIESYLRTFPYDVSVPATPAKRDTADYLLFDLKKGYFDYQSTAMAVMLRTLGVPARVAVGYVLDPDSVVDTKYTVRKSDAYSWVEVFFPGFGWVNFNPTQDRPAGGAGGLGAGAAAGDDAISPSLEDLFPPDDLLKPIPDNVAGALAEQPVEATHFPWYVVWMLALVLALAVVTVLSGRLAWNWGLGGLDERSRLWAKAHRLAAWAGLGGPRSETPREWSRRVGEKVDEEEHAARLASAYEEARYAPPGHRRVDEQDTSSAYLRLRNRLVKRILHYGQPEATQKKR